MNKSIWDTKGAIAEAIIPILEEYTDHVRMGKMQCLPTWVLDEDEELSDYELTSRWLSYLESIIYSFNLEISNHALSISQKDKVQKKGLEYFSKYYPHLWD